MTQNIPQLPGSYQLSAISFRLLCSVLCALFSVALTHATPIKFDIPAQAADTALQTFIKQAGAEVMFDKGELKAVKSNAVVGEFEVPAALDALLEGTGFRAGRRASGLFTVSRVVAAKPGSIEGTVREEGSGKAVAGAKVQIAGTENFALTDKRGRFTLEEVPAGAHVLEITAGGMQRTKVTDIMVRSGYRQTLSTIEVPALVAGVEQMEPYIVSAKKNEGVVELDPFEVEGQKVNPVAGGNLDLPRTETDALAFTVFDRDELLRSGAVNLEAFLTRNLLQNDPSNVPLLNNASSRNGPAVSSTGLNLRQLGTDETVILVNGRRMPDTPGNNGITSQRDPPDLRTIPLAMVERVEVLPSSGSAIYGDGATGGVVNIILRRNVQATEFTTLYDNAFGYDAPRLALTLVHGLTALDGKLQALLTASWRKQLPPTESELGYFAEARQRIQQKQPLNPAISVFDVLGSTPNVNGIPTGPATGFTLPFASVPRGYDGSGGPTGIASALRTRAGVANLELFPGPVYVGTEYQYGSESLERSIRANVLFRPNSALEFSLDAGWSGNRVGWRNHVAYNSIVQASSPFNPFGTTLSVYFWDPHGEKRLGDDRLDTDQYSLGLGTLLKLPRSWRLTLDGNNSRTTRVRHNVGYNQLELNALINAGVYNPFRDALAFPASVAVYDSFVHAADAKLLYSQEQVYLRIFNDELQWWAGKAQFVGGGEWQRDDSEGFNYDFRGIDFTNVLTGKGFTQDGYAGFAEMRGELLPARILPKWLTKLEGDLSLREAWKSTAAQETWSRHAGLKLTAPFGISLRASYGSGFKPPTYTQSYRDPTRNPTRPNITDPNRGNERYAASTLTTGNPSLLPEDGESVALGLIWEYGHKHKMRVTADWTRTEKVNEIIFPGSTFLLQNESVFSDRIQRQAPVSGDPFPVGRVSFIDASPVNLLGSQLIAWEATLRYQWLECFGGVLNVASRGSYLQSHKTQLSATAPEIQNIDNPAASFYLTKYRATWSTGWTKGDFGLGLDGLYNHSALIPSFNYTLQGSDRVDRYWQWDAWIQGNLSRFLPWSKPGVRAQLRINNLFGASLPLDVADTMHRRQYGDWRKQTYTLSLTTSF